MARTMTRWDPLQDLAEMRSRFDRLFGDLTDGGDREWMPAIDMVHDGDDLVIRAEVPGIAPDEVEVKVESGVLTLSGKHEETKEEKEHEGRRYIRRERRSGSFTRSITLPEGVDPKAITAKTRHGVLEVRVPLPKETAQEPVTIKPTAGE